jgi:lipopolysaccharide heptosyltransferase II
LFSHLQITDPRERWLIGVADILLGAASAGDRLLARPRLLAAPSRVLLLRLERIGDLLMTRAAIQAVREQVPSARIDLVVGSWNEAIARAIPGVTRVETLDVPWLVRGAARPGAGHLARTAWSWRGRRYDLAINFEGDIRSNALLRLTGVPRRVGFGMAGGGSLLTDVVAYDPRRHAAVNALRLVERAFMLEPGALERGIDPRRAASAPPLVLPERARLAAAALLGCGTKVDVTDQASGQAPWIALHPGGDRTIKIWAPDRFVELARRLAARGPARFVLTGGPGDRAVADAVASKLSPALPVVNLAGRADLLTLAAVLERTAILVTGDTGPMHLAAAVGTPVVGIFGPSDPGRWGPLSHASVAVRIDLPCSPCNRIRRPPARCVGHVPDCLTGVDVDRVYDAAVQLLDGAPVEIVGTRTTGGGTHP